MFRSLKQFSGGWKTTLIVIFHTYDSFLWFVILMRKNIIIFQYFNNAPFVLRGDSKEGWGEAKSRDFHLCYEKWEILLLFGSKIPQQGANNISPNFI